MRPENPRDGSPAQMRAEATLDFLQVRASSARWITSVCTGSLILGAAGLLQGYRATSHWCVRDTVLPLLGATPVDERVVFDRNRVTAAGVSAGLHFALALSARLRGADYAKTAKLVAEYAPQPPFDAGSPAAAGPAITREAKAILANLIAEPIRRLQPNPSISARRSFLRGVASLLPDTSGFRFGQQRLSLSAAGCNVATITLEVAWTIRTEALTAALGIMCKAPHPGRTKTRLASVIGAERAAALSGCFLRDVAAAVAALPASLGCQGYGVYAPSGADAVLRPMLPQSFQLLLQEGADFGNVLATAARTLLKEHGHEAVILINADSPTLPPELLADAVVALRRDGDRVVLGPATDGGYTLIGLKQDHPELFADIPWSTSDVLRLTLERAAAIALPVTVLPVWYDVDDAQTLQCLRDELAGQVLPFAAPGFTGGPAFATRALIASWTE